MIKIRKDSWWMFILIFFFSQLTGISITFLLKHLWNIAYSMSTIMTLGLFCANTLAILLWLYFRSPSITWQRTMAGLKGGKGRRTGLVFLLALPLIVLTNLVQEVFFPDILNLLDDSVMRGLWYHPIGLLTISFLGPLAEELLFRGGVQHDLSLHHSDQGCFVPIALSAVLFSLIHMNPAQMPVAFILGCLLGFAYWWTDSLIAPVCIHVFNNTLACVMTFLSPNEDSIIHFLGGPTGAGITATICVFFFVVTLRAVRKETA